MVFWRALNGTILSEKDRGNPKKSRIFPIEEEYYGLLIEPNDISLL